MFNLFVFFSREGVHGSSSSSSSSSGSSSSSSIGSRKKVTVAAAAVVEAAVVAVIVAVVVLKIYSSICSRSLYGSSCCGCGCSCGRCSSSLRTAPSYPCLSSCLPSLSPSVSLDFLLVYHCFLVSSCFLSVSVLCRAAPDHAGLLAENHNVTGLGAVKSRCSSGLSAWSACHLFFF